MVARLTIDDAKMLGLTVHRLLTWNFANSSAVVIKPGMTPTHLVYGLDDFQGTRLVKVDTESDPPEVTVCKSGSYSGVPLRPLYFDLSKGMSRRAIPLDWYSGVSYDEWRTKVPTH